MRLGLTVYEGFFLSAVLGTRKSRLYPIQTSVENRLSGKLSPNLSGAPGRFRDMTILNREGLQACRVGCRRVRKLRLNARLLTI
jgi:hypothetical protein